MKQNNVTDSEGGEGAGVGEDAVLILLLHEKPPRTWLYKTPFNSACGFCASGIQAELSRDDLSLFHVSGASAGKT